MIKAKRLEKKLASILALLEEEKTKVTVQNTLRNLSDLMIENSGQFRNYNNQDLWRATFIFSDVLLDRLYSRNKKSKNMEELGEKATEVGLGIKKLIKKATGLDMYDITSEMLGEDVKIADKKVVSKKKRK